MEELNRRNAERAARQGVVPGETRVVRSWKTLWRSKEVKLFEPAKPSLVRALHSVFKVRFWFAGTAIQQVVEHAASRG